MEVFVEDLLNLIDSEVNSITSDILSVSYPIELVKSARATRDKLIWLGKKVEKLYEKHKDEERGFKWE